MPTRIAELINTMPAEVRQFATIITGDVTNEQVVRKVGSTQTEVQTHSIFHPDPAVALFDTFAIAGYGGTSAETARALYQGHPIKRLNSWLVISLLSTAAAAVAAEPFVGGRGAIGVAAIGLFLIAVYHMAARFSTPSQ